MLDASLGWIKAPLFGGGPAAKVDCRHGQPSLAFPGLATSAHGAAALALGNGPIVQRARPMVSAFTPRTFFIVKH